MSRSTRRPSAPARRPLAAAGIAAALALGCATTPLEKRDWYAVETEHYAIRSSLSEDRTRELAAELERFRVAAEFVWGSQIAPAPVRTRVYAFDDRGLGSRLTLAGERSYLLTSLRGDRIVLRTGEGWSGDARVPLELAYARRLFWNASGDPLPPWYEEGLPQLASTLDVEGEGARVGIPRQDHVKTLRRSLWIPFERLLSADDLGPWSGRELELFEAESWALVHYLKIGPDPEHAAHEELRRALAHRGAADSAESDDFAQALQRTVWRQVSGRELASIAIAIPSPPEAAAPALRPLAKHEVLEVLGSLALAAGQDDRARRHFESALAEDPGSVAALLGLGGVLAAAGDTAGAEARYDAARSRAPDDPMALLDLARLSLDTSQSGDAAGRTRAAERARDLYRRCIALAPDIPEGHAGLAESELALGNPDAAGAALADARRLLPGDASLGALAVRVALAEGEDALALREAVRLGTRARGPAEREAARQLLDRVEMRAALR